MLMKESAVIWITVVNATHFHTIPIMVQIHIASINRIKIDFEITATSIAATVLVLGAVVARALSLIQTITMADTLNQMVAQSAEVLHVREVTQSTL